MRLAAPIEPIGGGAHSTLPDQPDVEHVTDVPASRADLSPSAAELTFPASDPLDNTTEGGVALDAAALRQAQPAGAGVRHLIVAGLRGAYQSAAAASAWAPALAAQAGDGGLRDALTEAGTAARFHTEQLQRALAWFGASHDAQAPGAPPVIAAAQVLGQPLDQSLNPAPDALRDLALAVAVQAERAAALAACTALAELAAAASLTDPLPPLRDCVAGLEAGRAALSRLIAETLVPAALRSPGEVPASFARLVFAAA